MNEKKYIKKYNLNNFLHLQIPRKIWELYLDKKISTGAFKIYVEFFDRLKLSARSNWVDKDNNVYIKYSYNEIMINILKNNSKGTVAKALTELKNLNLIIQEKGVRISSRFYLTNILNLDLQKSEKETTECKKFKKETVEVSKNGLQKSVFVDSNNNYYSHTNKEITTTKERSSELNSIKEYLNSKEIDDFTRNNILKICELKDLYLTRVEELFNYAKANQKGFGYIVKALRNDWKLNISKAENEVTEKIIKSIYEYALDYKQFNYNRTGILDVYDRNTEKYKDNNFVKKYRKKIEKEMEE
ncbi:replication initiator protein A [Fusobacterium sp. MFO224]|uniref:replication initiator protein A n=1 Tax=Fusobacterium sp. MFO224 TaxID=3378070 RepID=UPI003854F5BF